MSESLEEIVAKLQDPAEIDAWLEQLDRIDYENSLYQFHRAAWRHMDPAPWVDSWAIEAIAEHLQAVVDGQIRRLLINCPPRIGKSSLCSVSLPAWCWAQPETRWGPTSGPQVQFMHASYAEKLSLRDSVKCRTLIQSPFYQRLWGARFRIASDQNVKSRFRNDKGGERLITSIGGGTTGEGMMIGIIDDANAAGEAFSEATTQSTNDWWDQTMRTRLNDARTGAFIGVQQRLAEDDWSGHILSKDRGEWTHLCLPLKYEPERSYHTVLGLDDDGEEIRWVDPRTEEGEILWPERFPQEEVDSLERDLGPYAFAGQMQQTPRVKGGGIIKRAWWGLWEDQACGQCDRGMQEAACKNCRIPNSSFPPMDFILASLDTAYTEKEENDPSAMTLWGVYHGSSQYQATRMIGPDGRPIDMAQAYNTAAPKIVLMYAWEEWLEIHQLVEKVATTCRMFGGCDRLLVEAKASGISVAQEIQRIYGNEKFGVQMVNPGAQDKVARLHSVVPLFSDGMVHAPDRKWAEKVIAQTELFPKSKHKDLTDTVSQALRHLRDTGLLIRSQERLEDLESARAYKGKPPEPLYPG